MELFYVLRGQRKRAHLRTRSFLWTYPWLRVRLAVKGPGSSRLPDR